MHIKHRAFLLNLSILASICLPNSNALADPAETSSSKTQAESTASSKSTPVSNNNDQPIRTEPTSDSAAEDSQKPNKIESVECEQIDENDNTPKWKSKIAEGSSDLFYFVEAVSGKKLKTQTFDLLEGVTDIELSDDHIKFIRSDKQELIVGADTTGGAKFYKDWEKSKINLQEKFGDQGKTFLENIQSIHLSGNRIEVNRKGPEEFSVDLGDKKLHPAFDLRSIRFKKIAVTVDSSGAFPKLRDINGVVAVIKAPGFSFPVEVKDFCKKRLETENDITVGVTDPVPSALRAFFFLPSIFHFHFRLKRKVN